MDVATIVSIILAVITAVSLLYSRVTAKASKDSAGEAKRSANAAEKSAQEAKRSADATERSADAAERADARAEQDAAANRVLFNLVHLRKSAYQLSNDGTDAAYGVTIDAGDLGWHGAKEFDQFPSDHAEKILVSISMGTKTDAITVTWHYNEDRSDPPSSKTIVV